MLIHPYVDHQTLSLSCEMRVIIALPFSLVGKVKWDTLSEFGPVPGTSVCSLSVSYIYSGRPLKKSIEGLSQQCSYKWPRLGMFLNGRQVMRQVFAGTGMGGSGFYRQREGLERGHHEQPQWNFWGREGMSKHENWMKNRRIFTT